MAPYDRRIVNSANRGPLPSDREKELGGEGLWDEEREDRESSHKEPLGFGKSRRRAVRFDDGAPDYGDDD